MTFNTTDARTLEDAAELCAARPDLRHTRHVVIYPDRFWAIAAARHRAGRASLRAKSAFVSAIRRPSHIAMWATFAVCYALLASGVL
jgi:hypothetical protein